MKKLVGFLVVLGLLMSGIGIYKLTTMPDDIVPAVKQEEKKVQQEKKKPISTKKNDKYRDKKFSVKYAFVGDRTTRYGAINEAPIFKKEYLNWTGARHLTYGQMDVLVRAVYKRLPHIRTTDQSVLLMIETIIAESDGGIDIINKYGDLGICQIKVSTSKDLLEWLKDTHPDIRDAILKFRNPRLSEKDNLLQNIPYGIAIGITHYWRMVGPKYHTFIRTVTDRGVMWKSKYNTSKGYGTVNAYVKRNETYADRIKPKTVFLALD